MAKVTAHRAHYFKTGKWSELWFTSNGLAYSTASSAGNQAKKLAAEKRGTLEVVHVTREEVEAWEAEQAAQATGGNEADGDTNTAGATGGEGDGNNTGGEPSATGLVIKAAEDKLAAAEAALAALPKKASAATKKAAADAVAAAQAELLEATAAAAAAGATPPQE